MVVCGCETPPGVSLRSRGDVDRAAKGQPFSMHRACVEREREREGNFKEEKQLANGRGFHVSCCASFSLTDGNGPSACVLCRRGMADVCFHPTMGQSMSIT